MDVDPGKVVSDPMTFGAVGSLIALKWIPGDGYLAKIFNFLAGTACGGIVAPALAEWQSITSDVMRGAMAFVIGMLGLSAMDAIVRGIKEIKLGEIINEIVSWWFKRKG